MPKQAVDQPQLPTHGAAILPSVTVDSYNLEIEDEDGFVGDKATKGAFSDPLDKWRQPLKEVGQDPLGSKPSDEISNKKLAALLAEGEPDVAALVQSAVEEFAQQLTQVIRRFLRLQHRSAGLASWSQRCDRDRSVEFQHAPTKPHQLRGARDNISFHSGRNRVANGAH
jgi:hypothetical protein